MSGPRPSRFSESPEPRDDDPEIDLQRLGRLRQRPAQALEHALTQDWADGAGAALVTSRSGDLALWRCHDRWTAPYVPPLLGHLLVVTLAPAHGCRSWLPGEGHRLRHLGIGEVLILPAGEAGYLHWPREHQLLLLGLRPRLLYAGQAEGGPMAARSGLVEPVIHGIASALLAAGERDAPSASRLADHLGRALAAHLSAHYTAAVAGARAGLSQARLQHVLAFLDARVGEPVQLAEAAAVAGCSVHHFAHLFKAAMGVAPMRYVRDLRMQRARELVETSQMSLREIGLQVGLPQPSHFSQAFRAHWKTSPSALRRTR